MISRLDHHSYLISEVFMAVLCKNVGRGSLVTANFLFVGKPALPRRPRTGFCGAARSESCRRYLVRHSPSLGAPVEAHIAPPAMGRETRSGPVPTLRITKRCARTADFASARRHQPVCGWAALLQRVGAGPNPAERAPLARRGARAAQMPSGRVAIARAPPTRLADVRRARGAGRGACASSARSLTT